MLKKISYKLFASLMLVTVFIILSTMTAIGSTNTNKLSPSDVSQISPQLGLSNETVKDVKDIDDTIECVVSAGYGIYDFVTITRYDNGISMHIIEGEKENKVEFLNDGRVFLDGKLVLVESENTILRVGGTEWTAPSKTPKKQKNETYGSYGFSYGTRNVLLSKALESISYSAFVALISSTGPAGVAIGITSTIFWELVNYNPKSKNCSYKVYTARGKNNTRYLKQKTFTYAKTNYEGKHTTSYAYGVVI